MNKKELIEEWEHFCKCINWGNSFLDARAVVFMNEFRKNLGELK